MWDAARCVRIWRHFGSFKNALHEIGTRAIFSVGADIFSLPVGTVWYTAQCVHIWRHVGSFKNALYEMGTRSKFLSGMIIVFALGSRVVHDPVRLYFGVISDFSKPNSTKYRCV